MTGRKVRRSVKVDDLNDPFQNKSLNGAVSVKDGIGIGRDCTAEGKGGSFGGGARYSNCSNGPNEVS